MVVAIKSRSYFNGRLRFFSNSKLLSCNPKINNNIRTNFYTYHHHFFPISSPKRLCPADFTWITFLFEIFVTFTPTKSEDLKNAEVSIMQFSGRNKPCYRFLRSRFHVQDKLDRHKTSTSRSSCLCGCVYPVSSSFLRRQKELQHTNENQLKCLIAGWFSKFFEQGSRNG